MKKVEYKDDPEGHHKRIGILQILKQCCDDRYASTCNENHEYLIARCTPWEYRRFKTIVEEIHPGICEYDYV